MIAEGRHFLSLWKIIFMISGAQFRVFKDDLIQPTTSKEISRLTVQK